MCTVCCCGAARATIDTIRSQTDKLDVLVNNAGTTWGQDFSKYPDKGKCALPRACITIIITYCATH